MVDITIITDMVKTIKSNVSLPHVIYKRRDIGEDRVLERILLPILKCIMIIMRQNPSEVGTTENELRYSILALPDMDC